MQINPLNDLGPPLDRQDLADMWNGALSAIPTSELSVTFIDIGVASSPSDYPSDPTPGALVYDRVEQLMYCFHDAIEGTGVSLWLAIGPDRVDVACLAAEPLQPGEPVEPVYDRWVRAVRGWRQQTDGLPRALGINQWGIVSPMTASIHGGSSVGNTAASGSWINVGVDGLMWALLSNQASYPSETLASWNTTRFLIISEATGVSQTLLSPASINTITKRFPVLGMTFLTSAITGQDPVVKERILTKILFGPRMVSTDQFTG